MIEIVLAIIFLYFCLPFIVFLDYHKQTHPNDND